MSFAELIKNKIDFKTKPLKSLGLLEKIGAQICEIQQTLNPKLNNPYIVIFAADHGIAKCGVSAYPQEVTWQMVQNFLDGGAAINVFASQHQINLKIVDAGVNHYFLKNEKLINHKIDFGTRNFIEEPALIYGQVHQCIDKGGSVVEDIVKNGCNIIGFGEMGIGNTSSSAIIFHRLFKIPLDQCIGLGTGLDDIGLQHKIEILSQANNLHPKTDDIYLIMQFFGGFEIIQMVGAFLKAKELGIIILVDGFIATAAYACAYKINPEIINNTIFTHQSDEKAHAEILKILNIEPLLKLNLRLGEGTGCALAYPLIESSIKFINEMASFETAKVTNK